MVKKGFTVHIEESLIDDFRRYCNLNALKVSAKVELLIQKEIENAKINPTLVEMFQKILDGEKILRAQKNGGQKVIASQIIHELNKMTAQADAQEAKAFSELGHETVFNESVNVGTSELSQAAKTIKTDKIESAVPTIEQLKKLKGV